MVQDMSWHKLVFDAVAIITQMSIDNGEKMFHIISYDNY